MKLNKIALAVTGMLLAASAAQAGQIQSNVTSIAREVVVNDLQEVSAPQINYTFVGSLRNTSQITNMQVQLVLPAGSTAKWTSTVAAKNVFVLDPVSGKAISLPASAKVSADGKVLYATFTIAVGAAVNNPIVAFNPSSDIVFDTDALNAVTAGANVATPPDGLAANRTRNTLAGLKGIVGDLVSCDKSQKSLDMTFAHYNGVSDASFIATDANTSTAGSEHTRPGAQNTATVLLFPTNIGLTVTNSTRPARIDVQQLSTKFVAVTAVDTAGPTQPVVGTTVTTTQLGTIAVTKLANGYDLNLTNVYGSLPVPVVFGPGPAAASVGAIEAIKLQSVVTGSFATGSKLWVNAFDPVNPLTSQCPAAPGTATVVAAGATSVTLDFTTAFGAALPKNLQVCYENTAGNVIPSSVFAVTSTLVKQAGTNDKTATFEQPNSCAGSYAIGGGIKIDVRNYASYAQNKGTSTASVIRIINNSESRAADVFGQIIYEDGTYGPWGKLADLAPRQALNMTNQAIEAKLVNTAPEGNPFANTVYKATTGTSVINKNSGADRLRITSDTGTTLRVQSFIATGGQIINTSDAQGVDFEAGVNSRTALDGASLSYTGQDNSQDAINGLAK